MLKKAVVVAMAIVAEVVGWVEELVGCQWRVEWTTYVYLRLMFVSQFDLGSVIWKWDLQCFWIGVALWILV